MPAILLIRRTIRRRLRRCHRAVMDDVPLGAISGHGAGAGRAVRPTPPGISPMGRTCTTAPSSSAAACRPPANGERGRLKGYRLRFNLDGTPKGKAAPANVRPDPDAEVWGVLYRITLREMVRLNSTEGVPGGAYHPTWLPVEDANGQTIDAMTYVAVGNPEDGQPSLRYIKLLRDGAKAHGLPDAWLQLPESVGTPPTDHVSTPPFRQLLPPAPQAVRPRFRLRRAVRALRTRIPAHRPPLHRPPAAWPRLGCHHPLCALDS